MQEGVCILLGVEGEDAIYRVNKILGDSDPKKARNHSLRQLFGVSAVDNKFYNSQNAIEYEQDLKVLGVTEETKDGLKVEKIDSDEGMNYFE